MWKKPKAYKHTVFHSTQQFIHKRFTPHAPVQNSDLIENNCQQLVRRCSTLCISPNLWIGILCTTSIEVVLLSYTLSSVGNELIIELYCLSNKFIAFYGKLNRSTWLTQIDTFDEGHGKNRNKLIYVNCRIVLILLVCASCAINDMLWNGFM